MAALPPRLYTKTEDTFLNNAVQKEKEGSAKYKAAGSAATEAVIKILKEAKDENNGKYMLNIARQTVSGSIAKGSSLGPAHKPDYDVVIFFNVPDEVKKKYTKPNLEDMPSDEIPKILAELIKRITKIAKDSFSKGLKYKFNWKVCVEVEYNGFEFDIVPAINFHESQKSKNPMNDQWIAVLKRCEREKKHLPFLASSMAEKVVEYVKNQEPFTARLIVLAKLWTKKCVTVKQDMCAKSTIVELIAAKVGQDELKLHKNEASTTRAFEQFLEILAKPRSQVKIILSSKNVPFTPGAQAQRNLNEKTTGIPMLIDPVNPFFNYLSSSVEGYGIEKGWKALSESAKRSLTEFRTRPKPQCADWLGRTLGDYSS